MYIITKIFFFVDDFDFAVTGLWSFDKITDEIKDVEGCELLS
jgi:hypothetical protein